MRPPRLRSAKAVLRPPRVPEKAEQAHIVQLLGCLNAAVFVLGRPSPNDGRQHRGTGQTPGVPDLVAFLPSRGDRPTQQVWIECKAVGGMLRPEQRDFRALCECAGVAHVVGGLDAVIAWLVDRGYITAGSVPHYRQPPTAEPRS